MKLLELSFLFICLFPVSAEENLRLPDTRALALGGNGVTLSSFSNPALVQLSTDKVTRILICQPVFIWLRSDTNGIGRIWPVYSWESS